MKKLMGPMLGLLLAAAIVSKVDVGVLNLPSWLPTGHARHPASADKASVVPRQLAVLPAQPQAEAPRTTIAVTRIVDGDTLTVADGRQIRLAQVDAAETSACFGSEATAALRRLTEGKTVTLRRPADAPKKDRYGRTVADVLVNGKSVNEALVREGAAGWYASFAHEDLDLARKLEVAQAEAIKAHRGQWAACRRG